MSPLIEFIICPDEGASLRLQNATVDALSLASQRHRILSTVARTKGSLAFHSASMVDQLVKASRADFVAFLSPGDYFSPESLDDLVSGVLSHPNATVITCPSEYFDGTIGQRLGPENGGAVALLEDVVFGARDVQRERTFRLFRRNDVSKVIWNPAARGLESEHYMFAIFSPTTHAHLPEPLFHRYGNPESGSKLQPASSQFLNTARVQTHNRIALNSWSQKQQQATPAKTPEGPPGNSLVRLNPDNYRDALAFSRQLRESGHREVGLYVDSSQAWQWEFARRYNGLFDYMQLSTIALVPIIEPHTISSTRLRYPPSTE